MATGVQVEEELWGGGSPRTPQRVVCSGNIPGARIRVLTLGLGDWAKWTMGKGSRECGYLGEV